MTDKVKSTKFGVRSFLVNMARMLLGLVFMFSGVVKAIDPVGTQIKFEDYIVGMGLGVPMQSTWLLVMACLLAGFEILLGAYLVMGTYRRGTSFLIFLLMCILTPFTLYVAIANPVHDCGCFGDALKLTNWQTFFKNVILLLLSIFVWRNWRRIVPFVREKWQWSVTLVMLIIMVRFMYDNVNSLPVIDFRPYSIGTDLKQQVLENGNPEMSDFFLMNSRKEDVTADVLDYSGYTFLLVSPHLYQASSSDLDLIDGLADYCEEYGYGLVCLTASTRDEIDIWAGNTGARYQFLLCDEIPLKTMVRSNPGLVLLGNGYILNKWSHSDIPDEEALSGPLESLNGIVAPLADPIPKTLGVILLFLLPLLLMGIITALSGKKH